MAELAELVTEVSHANRLRVPRIRILHANRLRGRRILNVYGHLAAPSALAGIDARSGKLNAHWLRAPRPVCGLKKLNI